MCNQWHGSDINISKQKQIVAVAIRLIDEVQLLYRGSLPSSIKLVMKKYKNEIFVWN